MRNLVLILTLLCVVVLPWKVIETENAHVIYPDGFEEHAFEVAKVFENLRSDIVSDFSNDPGKITIVIEDGGTHTNAFADILTRNITLLTWSQASVWLNFSDLYKTLIIHEFTHMVHLTKEKGINRFVTDLTGFPIFDPQPRSPFVEAVTVFEESKRSEFSGRLNNPFLDSLVRSYAKSWRYSLAGLEKPPNYWFLSGTSYYIVPANFLEHLVNEKGWDTFGSFLDDYSFKVLGIGLDSAFKRHYGDSMGEIYEEWLDSIGKDFKIDGERVLKLENVAITEIESDGSEVYFKATVYGYDSLIGEPRSFIGRLNGNGSEKVFDSNLPIGKFIPTKDGVYYTVKVPDDEIVPGFWRYKTRLGFLKKGSNFPERIYEGYMSDFDVDGDDIYIATYDPKERVSRVLKNDEEIFDLKGFVRDIEVMDGKIYALVMEDGRSSDILLWDGELRVLTKDQRFKYSLKECGSDTCFLMFDDGANVYKISDEKLYKMTDGVVAGDFAVVNDGVYFSAFSDSEPSIGIYETKPKVEGAKFLTPSENEEPFKDVKVEEKSYSEVLLGDLIVPDIRIPYVLYDGTSTIFGVGLVESSPDYRFTYALSPFYVSNSGFGFGVLANLLLPGNFTVRGYILKPAGAFDLPDSASLFLSWKKFVSFNPWTTFWFTPSFEILYPLDLRIGFLINGKFGRFSLVSRTDLSILRLDGKQSFKVSLPIFKTRLSAGLDLDFPDVNFEFSLEDEFPVIHLDLGIYDPLLHVGDVFAGVGISYDDSPSLNAFLKTDFSQFFTHSRNFLKIGVSYRDEGLSPIIEVSSSF